VEATVQQLLEQAETTRNLRLFELANLTLKRHRDRVAQPEPLALRAAQGLQKYAQSLSHIAGVQRSGRSAAGLPLREWGTEAAAKGILPSLASIELALGTQVTGEAD
jgi:hypothetical protein